MTPNEQCAAVVRKRVGDERFGGERSLNDLLRLLGRWRAHLLAQAHVKRHGPVIGGGPFAGMRYLPQSTEGCLLPRLLGTYESELHPALQSFVERPPDAAIDIGCAEGYYAVGLARLMPDTPVYAYDVDPRARAACEKLCALNGVVDRVSIRGEFTGETFAEFTDRSVLVLMDAEGFEDDLLKPEDWPALRTMNLIVETHDVYRPGVLDRLIERFEPTHRIEVLRQQPKTQPLPDWFADLGHLDQLLAVWEFRVKPTPWLVMRPK
jgi:hypothetical protein